MLIRYTADSKGRPVQKAVVYTKDEHKIPREKIDGDAIYVITRLRENGYAAYIVGGAVRDLLIGKTPKDFDIVTDAQPSKIKRIFRNSRIIGKRFRLVHVFFGPKIFEVSTFRSNQDGSVGNVFGTMDEDVQRRDFSLNALYYDPQQEQVIDYVHGVEDIFKKRLVPVIPLDRIFVEDPVRMLRAVKYSSTTGCKMKHSLKSRLRKSAVLLQPVSPSRLTEELMKIINSGHSFEIVSSLLEYGIYPYLQPAASNMIMESRKFQESYLRSLMELDKICKPGNEIRLGEKLVYLLRDFMAGLTDWKQELEGASTASEIYKNTWAACRNFVLPMNPQRTELEYAIKEILASYGLTLRNPKKARRRPAQSKKPRTSASGKGQ